MNALPPPDGPGWNRPSVWSFPATPPVAERRVGAPLPPPLQPAPPKRPRRWPRRLGLAAAFVLFAFAAGFAGALVARQLDDDPRPPQRASNAALDVAEERGAMGPIDVAAVAAYLAPSVVTVSTDIDGGELGVGRSIGTGFFTTSDGEILTNAHIVDDATEVRVRLAGETEPRPAELVGIDSSNDLALLRIAGDGYVPVTFAEPDSIRVGDDAVVIGFALDLDGGPSVTLGIVSALDRTIVTSQSEALDGLIQTDAAISSGNSGGPLVNALGEVIGINTAVARGDAVTAASNVGFAISVGEAIPTIDRLRAQGDGVEREQAFLGVGLNERLDGGQGALVGQVNEGTPAEEAGIEVGDIVIAVDDHAIDGAAGLQAAIRDHEPGDSVEVQIVREGEVLTLSVTLAARPDS